MSEKLNTIKSFKLKEKHIYYLLFFFIYGLNGAGTDLQSKNSIIFLLLPIFIIPITIYFIKENDVIIDFERIFFFLSKKENFLILIIFLFILFFFSYEKIILSITDDELAYVNLGLIHSNFLIKQINEINFLKNYQISSLFHLISLILILSTICYFYLINLIFKKKPLVKLILITLTVLFVRYLIFINNGNHFPHPTLVGLAPLISVSIFGLNDLSLKFSSLIVFSFFIFFVFNKLKNFTSSTNSFFIVLGLFTVPGLLYLGISVEQALWSMICFTIVLFQISESSSPNYKKIFITILFFSFFRILSLTAVLIIFFYLCFNSQSIKEFIIKSFYVAKKSYPLLLIVPFILFSFINKSQITVNRVGFDFINLNFITEKLPGILIDSFTIPFSIFLFILLFISIFLLKDTKIIISFLIFQIIIYGKVITQNNKYNYEIFVPFIILLVYLILKNQKKIFKNILSIIFALFIFSNYGFLKNMFSYCKNLKNPLTEFHTYDHKRGCRIHDSHPFDLSDAYVFLKNRQEFSFQNLYVPGVYYGILPSIINGMKLKEYQSHIKSNKFQNQLNINNNINWHSASATLINMDSNINYVLIGDMSKSRKLIKELNILGWKKIYHKKNEKYLTEVTVMFRK